MSIDGIWYNELGSQMTLNVTGATSIAGVYQTVVGDAYGIYDLTGSYDSGGDPSNNGQATGWVVVWVNEYGNSGSVTTWSGQYQIIDGIEEIETIWLLTTESASASDWSSTRVNKDTFTRTPPSEETVARAKKKRMPAHPVG